MRIPTQAELDVLNRSRGSLSQGPYPFLYSVRRVVPYVTGWQEELITYKVTRCRTPEEEGVSWPFAQVGRDTGRVFRRAVEGEEPDEVLIGPKTFEETPLVCRIRNVSKEPD